MKNFISYFYDLDIDYITYDGKKYFLNSGKDKFIFKVCYYTDIEKNYYNFNKEFQKYEYFFTLMPNKFNSLLSFIDNRPYVLLKVSNISDDIISLFDIKNNLYVDILDKNNNSKFPWTNLWENKIDCLENWLYEKKEQYNKYAAVINYYIGLSENALLYLKETLNKEIPSDTDRLVLQHYRLNVESTMYDYYDPTNIMIDHHSRDIGEYIKSSILRGLWNINDFENYLEKNQYSKYGLKVMYARILFPTFFFDYIEDSLKNGKEIDLNFLEQVSINYESSLTSISNLFNKKYGIEAIPWLIKKT